MYIKYVEKPLQAISNKEKLKKEVGDTVPAWVMNCVNHFVAGADFNKSRELHKIINKINSEPNATDYNYVTNPYKLFDERGKARKLPARIRNLDIITPVKNALTGERNDRSDLISAIVRNSDVDEVKKFILDGLHKEASQIYTAMELQKAGISQENDNEEMQQRLQQLYDKIQNIEVSYVDYRAIQGQDLVEYISYLNDVDEKKSELFDYWFDVGQVVTYKEVRHNSVHWEVINPGDVYIHNQLDETFIEDAEAVVQQLKWSFNKIVDYVSKYVSADEIKKLEERYKNFRDNLHSSTTMYIDHTETKNNYSDDSTTGYRVVWKSLKLVQILVYTDEFGFQQEMEVDEDYKLNLENGDILLEKQFKEIWWKSYKFFDDYYFGWEEGLEQRNSFSNSDCKLPFNGRVFNKQSNNIFSFGKVGLDFQELYNIYNFRFEMIMAKNKDKLMLMPLGLVPKNWKRETWMYFADATGMAWFDETNPKIAQVLQGLKAIDLGLGNYASSMRDFMIGVKNEWWDFIGMNRQRFGEVMASDGKGTTEQAIFRSSIITSEFNRKFDKFIEKDYQGFLDLAKLAFADGKITEYINAEGYKTTLNVIPEVLQEADLGIFMKDGNKERNNLITAKSVLQTYVSQNPKIISNVMEALEANSVSKISKLLKEAEKIEQQIAQQANEQAVELEKVKQGNLIAMQELKNKGLMDVAGVQMEKDITVADISAKAKIITANSWEPDHIMDEDALLEKYHAQTMDIRKQEFEQKYKEKEQQFNKQTKDRELDIKEKDSQTKAKQANKKTQK